MRAKLELLTPEEMGRADHAAAALGFPVEVLMEQAGRAVARAIAARLRPCRTLVLCGRGNNGGDGVVAARILQAAGWPVAVAELGPPRWPWDGMRAAFNAASASRADLVIDAVFGAGLIRDVSGEAADALRAARRVVAVDLPSGVDGGTGQIRGFARKAELTVTFFRLKPGHLLLPGRTLCGETVLADIGLPDAVLREVPAHAFRNAPGLWRVPAQAVDGHKYDRGHATVLGGGAMTGAARLAALAARRAGAGLVTIAAGAAADLYRSAEAGGIVSDATVATLLEDPRRNAWVCGPGLGHDEAAAALPPLLAAGRQVVVDADALTLCAGAPERLRGATVLTPHAGEFARVFGAPGSDRPAAVRAAAALTAAVVLFKGADTIVASPDGRIAINDSAPPWLATAGSGDVLAGLIGGLLAQGMSAWEAACAGVWLHGRAAVHAGPHLIAEDLAPAFPRAFADASAAVDPNDDSRATRPLANPVRERATPAKTSAP